MYRDYTKFALATLVIFLAAVILVNLIVDPYRIYPKIVFCMLTLLTVMTKPFLAI